MARRLCLPVLLLFVLGLTACGGGGDGGGTGDWVMATAPLATPGAAGGTGMGVAEEALAKDAAEWVNAHRVANSLPALTWDGAVAQVAYLHSFAMDAISTLTHTIGGKGVDDRLNDAGIPWTACGENIAWNQPTGQAVAEAWMNSDGHRANILNATFVRFGMAVCSTGGGPYWTNVFVAP